MGSNARAGSSPAFSTKPETIFVSGFFIPFIYPLIIQVLVNLREILKNIFL